MRAVGPLSTTPEFSFVDGHLSAELVSVASVAAEIGTPFYLYSSGALTRAYRSLADTLGDLDPLLCYAVKANPTGAVLATLAGLGAGADVVSGGELERALEAGIPAERIVFSGVGKTTVELRRAVEAGILQINVESESELEALKRVAEDIGRPAPVALRTNPDVAAKTHEKISTGEKAHKFGIDFDRIEDVYRCASDSRWLRVRGLSVHIGSQLLEFGPFRRTFERVRGLVQRLRSDGREVRTLDLGGGIGIRYRDEEPEELAHYAELIRETLQPLGCRLIFEPGRTIVGNAGLLVTRVLYLKESRGAHFAVVDAAMNDLHRPALYGARHAVAPIREAQQAAAPRPFQVVGPICETSDVLATDVLLPKPAEGDLLAICSCGAYAASMASNYNSRLLAPEVMVRDERWELIRRRQRPDELVAAERLPDWLG